ncbi:hypothetical protein AB0I72_19355 [Nocardiopsis sp. NPDC049922]|uniref:hypothetical protein n=1 Tax=Nocardiopsis sp. NPDC049922 TaxID=3155157 RepID=UPI0033F601F9
MKIDVYPVAVLDDLLCAYRWARHAGRYSEALSRLRYSARCVIEQARAGRWRAVRRAFSGYLAEPTPFPPGLTRCGAGWTRARAERDLYRRMRTAGIR